MQVWLWEVLWSVFLVQPLYWAGHHWLSYKAPFFFHVTIWSRNGSSLLNRIRQDDTSKDYPGGLGGQFEMTIFFFVVSSWGTHILSFFTFQICFKYQTTIEWSMMSASATSHVVVRGSTSLIPSVGRCHFQCPTTILLVFKALVSFAKLLDSPLHCTFINSSWTNCVVDAMSCLHCFKPILN